MKRAYPALSFLVVVLSSGCLTKQNLMGTLGVSTESVYVAVGTTQSFTAILSSGLASSGVKRSPFTQIRTLFLRT